MSLTVLIVEGVFVGGIIGSVVAYWHKAKKDTTETRHQQIMKYLSQS